jgi:flagellar hook-associated protein 3 FlgL
VFAGHQTNKTPFDRNGDYAGDNGEMKIQVNKSAFVSMNLPGEMVFLGRNLGPDGLITSKNDVPRDTRELQNLQIKEKLDQQEAEEKKFEPIQLRAPANSTRKGSTVESVPDPTFKGLNILKAIKDFEIALRVNDKAEIQSAIDSMDFAITQVVNSRAQVGSRIMALNAAQESLQKSVVESKITASQNEDADLFQVVSDMNKTDSTLRATLETSGKVANLSLLDFLK